MDVPPFGLAGNKFYSTDDRFTSGEHHHRQPRLVCRTSEPIIRFWSQNRSSPLRCFSYIPVVLTCVCVLDRHLLRYRSGHIGPFELPSIFSPLHDGLERAQKYPFSACPAFRGGTPALVSEPGKFKATPRVQCLAAADSLKWRERGPTLEAEAKKASLLWRANVGQPTIPLSAR